MNSLGLTNSNILVGKFVARVATIKRGVNACQNEVDFDWLKVNFLWTNAVHLFARARG